MAIASPAGVPTCRKLSSSELHTLEEVFLVNLHLCLMLLELFRCYDTVLEKAYKHSCCTKHSGNDAARKCSLKTELEVVGIAPLTLPSLITVQDMQGALHVGCLIVDNSGHFFVH